MSSSGETEKPKRKKWTAKGMDLSLIIDAPPAKTGQKKSAKDANSSPPSTQELQETTQETSPEEEIQEDTNALGTKEIFKESSNDRSTDVSVPPAIDAIAPKRKKRRQITSKNTTKIRKKSKKALIDENMNLFEDMITHAVSSVRGTQSDEAAYRIIQKALLDSIQKAKVNHIVQIPFNELPQKTAEVERCLVIRAPLLDELTLAVKAQQTQLEEQQKLLEEMTEKLKNSQQNNEHEKSLSSKFVLSSLQRNDESGQHLFDIAQEIGNCNIEDLEDDAVAKIKDLMMPKLCELEKNVQRLAPLLERLSDIEDSLSSAYQIK